MVNVIGISPLQESSDPLSDDHLVSRLRVLCRSSKKTEIEIIRLLVILQQRHLDLSWTYSSLYKFCAERLGMTEGEAARRVAAARLIRKVPVLLEYLQAGKLSMTTLLCLRDYVNEENASQLLASVASKSKREVGLVLADRRPNADARPRRPRTVSVQPANGDSPSVEVSAPYRIEVAQSSQLHEKIELARALMARRGLSDGLVVVVEAAMDALLADLRGRDRHPPPQSFEGGIEDRRVSPEVEAPAVGFDAARSWPTTSEPRRSARIRTQVQASRKGGRSDGTVAPAPASRNGRSPGPRPKSVPSVISEALHRPLKQRPGPRVRDRAPSDARTSAGARPRSRANE